MSAGLKHDSGKLRLVTDLDELFTPRPHRVLVCPYCGGKLGHDQHPVTSETGHVFRARGCTGCGEVTHTKQGPEEVTP